MISILDVVGVYSDHERTVSLKRSSAVLAAASIRWLSTHDSGTKYPASVSKIPTVEQKKGKSKSFLKRLTCDVFVMISLKNDLE